MGVDENISCQGGHFLFLKPKSGLRARKIYEKTKKINEMCSEAFGYVSDNLVTTQMLFCDSRMIFKKIREKKFSASKMNFFRILGMPNFEPFFLNVHKNWRIWLQTALKNFLESDTYVQSIQKVRLGQGFPTHQLSWPYDA